jgi:hypothetical protein
MFPSQNIVLQVVGWLEIGASAEGAVPPAWRLAGSRERERSTSRKQQRIQIKEGQNTPQR